MAHDTSPHSFAARQADVRNGALIAGERDIDILHVIKDRPKEGTEIDQKSKSMIRSIMRFTSSGVRRFFHPDKRRNPFELSHVGGGFKGVHRFIVSNLRDRQT